ncbi:MAG: hypothetical protein WCD16_06180 [Paracoccaceae bacterium]
MLEAAEQHFQRTIAALNEIIKDVSEGRSARAKELRTALGDLNRAAQTAFDERSRVEKRIKTDGGIADQYALDFDAARDEIGRRLDCLRAARGTGEIPGRVE